MKNQLYYTKPAKCFEQALPLGNGRLGIMTYGNLRHERLSLNEDSLWSGYPKDQNKADAHKYLAACREAIFAKDYAKAKDIALWKENVAARWDSIHVVDKDETALQDVATGKPVTLSYTIDEQGLNDAIGLELVTLSSHSEDDLQIHKVYPFEMVKQEGNLFTFKVTFEADEAGSYKCAVRMYPKNDLLPHRQDFCYVKWID